MAVKGSGALSIATDIVGEFGGDAPHSLSEYYGGGPYVPAGANPGIATSGQINMGSHYGAVAATVLTISSNTNNYDIGAAAIAAGGDKSTPVILTINSGVTVGSTSTSTAAMYTGTGWSSGTTINITNNGSIVGASGSNTTGTGGAGGRGGNGASAGTSYHGSNGNSGSTGSGSASSSSNGGNAFTHSQTSDNNLSVIFDTAGTRSGGSAGTTSFPGGGGGGGGGAGASAWCDIHNSFSVQVSGGGGGGGARSGSGGSRGLYPTASNGSAGGTTTGGNGGAGAVYSNGFYRGGAGGRGGDLGASGAGGSGVQKHSSCYQNSYFGPKAGGSAGSSGSASGSAGSALSGNTSQIS